MPKTSLVKASVKASSRKVSARTISVVTPKMLNSITRKLISLTIQIDKSRAKQAANHSKQDE